VTVLTGQMHGLNIIAVPVDSRNVGINGLSYFVRGKC
jgi:hypothetical protein